MVPGREAQSSRFFQGQARPGHSTVDERAGDGSELGCGLIVNTDQPQADVH